MKPFSSSILSDSRYVEGTPLSESTSLNAIKETNEPMLYRLLQFDEAVARADIDATRDFYVKMLDLVNSKKETVDYDPAYMAVFNKFEAVKAASEGVLAFNRCGECPDVDRSLEAIFDRLSKCADATTTVNIIGSNSETPVCPQIDIMLNPIRDYSFAVVNCINNGGDLTRFIAEHADMDIVSMICHHMAKITGIEDADNFNTLIENYEKKFKFGYLAVPLSNIRNAFFDASCRATSCQPYICARDLYEYGGIALAINAMKINRDNLDIDKARKIVNDICDAIAIYTIIILKMNDISNDKRKFVETHNKHAIMDYVTSHMGAPTNESMSMFGDELDYQTVFDTLDPEDFNRTEYFDLSLVSEHVFKMDCIEARKYAIALEAKLLAEGRYDELYIVQEGMIDKIKSGVGKIVEAIKKLVAKFVADIMGIFAPEKVYLTKYKNIILNSTIPENTTVQFEGHALDAMQRLKSSFSIPTTSYNDLMAKPQQFESEEAFFEANKNAFGIGGTFKRNNDNSLADDLKVYWGYKDEKNPPPQMTFKDINPRIKEIYDFLLATEDQAKKLQREVKNLDRTFKNYTISAKNYGAKSQTNGDQKVETKQEYYSAIDDRWISLSEKTSIGPVEKPNTNNDSDQSNNNQSPNNNQNQQKVNTNMTRGDTDKEVKQSGDEESKIVRNMEIYTNTCRSVLTARATGFRYCHQELMAIMKAIVKAKLGDKADIRNDKDAQAAAKKEEQNKPAEEPKSTETGAAPNTTKRGFFGRKSKK